MALARIGLGANVGDAQGAIRLALTAMERLGTVARVSSLYRTKAWGVEDQDDFINAAALLETALEPYELLHGLKAIESELGRIPTYRWGPRAIDLDILAYDARRVDEPDLVIPHRDLHRRAFALVPLAEIDPDYRAGLLALPASDVEAVRRIEG